MISPALAASLTTSLVTRAGTSWPWYLVRASGFVAAGLLVLLVLSGIGHVTGFTYRFFEPITAWAIHKALAFGLLLAILTHVTFLMLDQYLPFSFAQVLVPFVSVYSNKTTLLGLNLSSIGVACGIFATYFILIIVASSLGWINSHKVTWRYLHWLSYAVAFLVFLHALIVGTDVRYGVFRAAWIMLGVVVILAVIGRLWRAGTLVKPDSASASSRLR